MDAQLEVPLTKLHEFQWAESLLSGSTDLAHLSIAALLVAGALIVWLVIATVLMLRLGRSGQQNHELVSEARGLLRAHLRRQDSVERENQESRRQLLEHLSTCTTGLERDLSEALSQLRDQQDATLAAMIERSTASSDQLATTIDERIATLTAVEDQLRAAVRHLEHSDREKPLFREMPLQERVLHGNVKTHGGDSVIAELRSALARLGQKHLGSWPAAATEPAPFPEVSTVLAAQRAAESELDRIAERRNKNASQPESPSWIFSLESERAPARAMAQPDMSSLEPSAPAGLTGLLSQAPEAPQPAPQEATDPEPAPAETLPRQARL